MTFDVRVSSVPLILDDPSQRSSSSPESALKDGTDILELFLQVLQLFGLRKHSNTASTWAVLIVHFEPKRINVSQRFFKRSLVVDELEFDVMLAFPLRGSLLGLASVSD